MRLFQFAYSPYAAKVRACLALKKLECEVVEVPYLDRKELVRISGGITIPVLQDGERVITDSAAITAYLDEHHARSLRSGAYGSIAVILEQWADGPFEDAVFRFACPNLEARFKELNGGQEEARAQFRFVKERKYGAGCLEAWRRDEAQLEAQLLTLLEPLTTALWERPFLLGGEASVGDAAVFGQLHMLEIARPGWLAEKAPQLVPWYERLRA